MVFKLLALAKVPVPLLVHVPPVATVTEPFKVVTALLAQTLWLAPALAVGAGVMVMVMVLVTGLQPALEALKVSTTEPVLISLGPGV